MPNRRQATLYLPESSSQNIEAIRSRFNPAQANLIRAHVTLCREDEVVDWEQFRSRLSSVGPITLELAFSRIVRDGDLVYAAVENSDSFDQLRNEVLRTENGTPRHHIPHLTLIHPRNGKCSDKTFRELRRKFKPFAACIDTITVIEQIDGGIWRDVFQYPEATVA